MLGGLGEQPTSGAALRESCSANGWSRPLGPMDALLQPISTMLTTILIQRIFHGSRLMSCVSTILVLQRVSGCGALVKGVIGGAGRVGRLTEAPCHFNK